MSLARFRALLGKMIWLASAVLPGTALACPACSARDGWSLSAFWVLGSMILVPFAVAGVVLRIVRRIEAESSTADFSDHQDGEPRG
jgi:hypothetical protein